MIYVSKEVAANEGVQSGHPKLSRSDIWKGLVMKAENALPFVPGMAKCSIVKRMPNGLVRDIIFRGEDARERITLLWRPAYGSRRYHGERDAGINGFSHIGLCTTDAARDEAFWTKVCNARVSDRIGDAALLRIDEAHHTIALFPTNRAGIQHINHQVATCD